MQLHQKLNTLIGRIRTKLRKFAFQEINKYLDVCFINSKTVVAGVIGSKKYPKFHANHCEEIYLKKRVFQYKSSKYFTDSVFIKAINTGALLSLQFVLNAQLIQPINIKLIWQWE